MPPGAKRFLQPRERACRRARACSAPSAAMFHSAPSMSSIDTNVGSPPIVSRTSPARQLGVDAVAERFDRLPLLVGVRLGDARRLVDAPHGHLVAEASTSHSSTAPVTGAALDGSGVARQRDVAFAREQAGRRIEADPAGARQVHLGPGVQVGEVGCRYRRTVERLDVGRRAESGSRRRSAPPARGGAAPARAASRCRGTSRCAASSVSSGVCTPGSRRMT